MFAPAVESYIQVCVGSGLFAVSVVWQLPDESGFSFRALRAVSSIVTASTRLGRYTLVERSLRTHEIVTPSPAAALAGGLRFIPYTARRLTMSSTTGV